MANMMPRDETAWGAGEVERRLGLQLSPCPFCAGPPYLFLSRIPHVTCGHCGADGPRKTLGSRDRLVDRQYRACKAWNLRPNQKTE
jgi:hypothetical protein